MGIKLILIFIFFNKYGQHTLLAGQIVEQVFLAAAWFFREISPQTS